MIPQDSEDHEPEKMDAITVRKYSIYLALFSKFRIYIFKDSRKIFIFLMNINPDVLSDEVLCFYKFL